MSTPGHSPLIAPAEHAPLADQRIVVIGGGMTGHRFAARLRAQDPEGRWTLTVIGEEPQQPYDRVHLSNWFASRNADLLSLDVSVWEDPRISLLTGDKAETIDRVAAHVTTTSGTTIPYDRLILATGSWAWAPRADGSELPGIFSYRGSSQLRG